MGEIIVGEFRLVHRILKNITTPICGKANRCTSVISGRIVERTSGLDLNLVGALARAGDWGADRQWYDDTWKVFGL